MAVSSAADPSKRYGRPLPSLPCCFARSCSRRSTMPILSPSAPLRFRPPWCPLVHPWCQYERIDRLEALQGDVGDEAKAAAQSATKRRQAPAFQPRQAKSTAVRLAVAKQQQVRRHPEDVGKFSKAMDTALPGKHTRDLYKLNQREASVLAQLQTGMKRLNGFLSRIEAAGSDQCACRHAREKYNYSSRGAFLHPFRAASVPSGCLGE